jgi:hypothetical protein
MVADHQDSPVFGNEALPIRFDGAVVEAQNENDDRPKNTVLEWRLHSSLFVDSEMRLYFVDSLYAGVTKVFSLTESQFLRRSSALARDLSNH